MFAISFWGYNIGNCQETQQETCKKSSTSYTYFFSCQNSLFSLKSCINWINGQIAVSVGAKHHHKQNCPIIDQPASRCFLCSNVVSDLYPPLLQNAHRKHQTQSNGCDQKIMKNEPIAEQTALDNAEDAVRSVMQKILTKLYGIEITETVTRRYGSELRGNVIIQILLTGADKHMLLFGLSERLVKLLYHKISGLFIQQDGYLDELEESALIEFGDILATYIMGALINHKITDYQFSGALYFSGYNRQEFPADHVIIDTQTKYGTLEVLYCSLNQ